MLKRIKLSGSKKRKSDTEHKNLRLILGNKAHSIIIILNKLSEKKGHSVKNFLSALVLLCLTYPTISFAEEKLDKDILVKCDRKILHISQTTFQRMMPRNSTARHQIYDLDSNFELDEGLNSYAEIFEDKIILGEPLVFDSRTYLDRYTGKLHWEEYHCREKTTDLYCANVYYTKHERSCTEITSQDLKAHIRAHNASLANKKSNRRF
jgi:hypothetical protein